jgi:hypothetical protein
MKDKKGIITNGIAAKFLLNEYNVIVLCTQLRRPNGMKRRS